MLITLKIAYTLYVWLIVSQYWRSYGLQNFLWMSDIGFFLTLPALWLESPLLMSICSVAFLIPEIVWNLDFFIALLGNRSITGISDYMFHTKYPLFLRLLSLFHVALPIFWIGAAFFWGYDASALPYAVPLIWIIFTLTHCYTHPEANINWIFMPEVRQWKGISARMWLVIMLIGYPLLICVPTHMVMQRIFHRAG